MADIYSLVYQPTRTYHKRPYRFNRVQVDRVTLLVGKGIEGDYKSGRNRERQLNVMSYETVQQLKAEGYKTEPGELGEQIVVRGLDVMALQPGDRIQLGAEAIIEITAPREPCGWFGKVQNRDFNDVVRRVGVLAGVIQGGKVRVGDAVRVLEAVESMAVG